MSKKNQISAVVTNEQAATILEQINAIDEALKNVLVINLTAEDRTKMLKMGNKTLAFVQKTLDYAEQNELLRPSFLDLSEAKKDYDLAAILMTLRQRLSVLIRAIEDAEMVAGGEAYNAALIFYNSVKGAARSNIAGSQVIEDDLRQRFPRKRIERKQNN